jgi:hypothetical protein
MAAIVAWPANCEPDAGAARPAGRSAASLREDISIASIDVNPLLPASLVGRLAAPNPQSKVYFPGPDYPLKWPQGSLFSAD